MPAHISPSQISTWHPAFGGCNRKWAWQKIHGKKTPPTDSQRLGTNVHFELENYYVRQVVPNQKIQAGRLAAKALHLIPTMNHLVNTEGKFRFLGRNAEYNGIIDLEYQDTVHNLPVVLDYKTSGNPKYMKSAEDLKTDPQAIMYAEKYFREHSDAKQVIPRWLYIFTKTLEGGDR